MKDGQELDTKLHEFKDYLLDYQQKHADYFTNYDNNLINYVVEEIGNPKPADPGKYKIPHKYLYEEMQKRCKNQDIYEVLSAVSTYKEYDGLFNEKQGKTLETLYNDDDNYLYMHNIGYRGQGYTKEELNKISKDICKDGLKLTTMGNEVGKINYTTINTKDNFGMLGFMQNWDMESGIIVLKIPKEKIDNNEPVIGSDKPDELSPFNPGAVLPEYVEGYLSESEFIDNPIPLEERQKRYKFKFSEKTTEKEML